MRVILQTAIRLDHRINPLLTLLVPPLTSATTPRSYPSAPSASESS